MKPEVPEWQTKFQRVLDAAHENKFVQVATVSHQQQNIWLSGYLVTAATFIPQCMHAL